VEAVLSMFHHDPVKARAAYRNFIDAGIGPDGYVPVPGTVPEV
jgi:hypothetical protein